MILAADIQGQLGNQLFRGAHLIALAADLGRTLVYTGFTPSADHFEGTANDALCRFPIRVSVAQPSNAKRERAAARMWFASRALRKLGSRRLAGIRAIAALQFNDGEYHNLDDPRRMAEWRKSHTLIVVGFHIRYDEGVRRHAEAIRRHFTPIAEHRARVDEVIARAREQCDVLVGVHIRRGDYRQFYGGWFHYPDDAYAAAMRQTRDLFSGKRVGFLVCTNDAIDTSRFAGLRVFHEERSAIVDLYALAACDRIIGPPSSFSTWAAFYGSVPIFVMDNPHRTLTAEGFRTLMLPEVPEGLTDCTKLPAWGTGPVDRWSDGRVTPANARS